MKKPLVLLILIVVLTVGTFLMFQKSRTQAQEIAKLQQEAAELQTLRDENTELKQYRAQAAEVERARKEQHELIKLRNEVSTLRTDNKQLTAKLTQASSAIVVMQENTRRLAAQSAAPVSGQATAAPDPESAKNACVNNLRLIDSAKQQWALEFKKTADDIPIEDDLQPYLGRGQKGEMPICPLGGVYSFGPIKEAPRCTIAGHVLP